MAYQPRRSASKDSLGRSASKDSLGPVSPLIPGASGSNRTIERGSPVGNIPRGSPDSLASSKRPATSVDDRLQIDDSSGEDESEQTRYGRVPLIGDDKMIIDDQNATYVIVFPKQKDRYGNGTVKPDAVRENPKADWERIFRKSERLPTAFKRGAMQEGEFQELVRKKFLGILRDSGLKAMQMESIDKDEIFLKVALDRDGDMICKLAEAYQYRMPFKRECYQKEQNIGPYDGGRPMRNADGEEVMAFGDYSKVLSPLMEPFLRVDEVRLISMHLDSEVSLREMEDQNIISRHFPGAEYDYVMKLHSAWADWQNVCIIPGSHHDGLIANYFGEEIAFFFRWLGLYTRMLGVVALVGVCAGARHLPDLELTQEGKDKVKICFGFLMVMWEGYLNKMNKASSARALQFWGMENFEAQEPALPSYDKNLEGTQGLKVRKMLGSVAVVVYMIGFVGVIGFVNWRFLQAMTNGHTEWASWQPTVQSIIIKVLSFVWRKISYYLVLIENHRTQSRFNSSLILNLSLVKIFVALWPNFYTALLKSSLEQTCGSTLGEAAHVIYRNIGWPKGVDMSSAGGVANSGYVPIANLAFLEGHWHLKDDKVCIRGCYPISCYKDDESETGKLICETNCKKTLEDSLYSLFLLQLVSTMAFIMVPIVLTWWEIRKEIKAVKRSSPDNKNSPDSQKSPDNKNIEYSFIQFQAKCHQVAPYHFQQWGGSYVEDFLDVKVGYALLVCFGMVCPMMSVIGFICMLIQYRLLAYRMTNVTCRPHPRGSQGIGRFAEVFEIIGQLSIIINVLITVDMMLPFRTLSFGEKLVCFIVAEKIILMLRSTMDYLIPETPNDVLHIGDFNNEFKKTLVKRKMANKEEKVNFSDVDIGLRRRNDPEGDSSSDEHPTGTIAWLRGGFLGQYAGSASP